MVHCRTSGREVSGPLAEALVPVFGCNRIDMAGRERVLATTIVGGGATKRQVLAEGRSRRGFASPFHDSTGPTAW